MLKLKPNLNIVISLLCKQLGDTFSNIDIYMINLVLASHIW